MTNDDIRKRLYDSDETDEERRIRFRKTEWYAVTFDGNREGSEEIEEGWVRVSGNVEHSTRMYCEHMGWNWKSVYIKDVDYLGVEH
jgi:hypothetical protein